MKNTVSEMKNTWGRIKSILGTTEEETSELEDTAIGTIQMKQKKDWRKMSICELWDNSKPSEHVIRVSEGKVKYKWYQKKKFEEIMVDFPNLET